MIPAVFQDRNQVVHILTTSFANNKSVNYIVRKGNRRKKSLQSLMEYSFDICHRYGKIFMSQDKTACALLLSPEKSKFNLFRIWKDIQLIFTSIGILNIKKVMSREARIKSLQPKTPFYYIWFIGVSPENQGKGIGTILLKEILAHIDLHNDTVCLETSTIKNLSWYSTFGFNVYAELDLGYTLYFLQRTLS